MSKQRSLVGWGALLSLAATQGCSSDSTPATTEAGGSSGTLGAGGAFSVTAGQSGATSAATAGGASIGGASAGTSGTLDGGGASGSGGSGATAGAGGSGGAAAGSGGATGGSSGSGGSGGSGPAAKWSQVYPQILVPLCGSTCHNGNTSTKYGGGLDIFPTDSARAYGNVVNQLPKPSPSGLSAALAYKCTGKGMRVVKGNAAKSILYSKVHDATPICGAPEPQAPVAGGPGTAHAPLTQTQLDMIASWINAGALNN